MYLGRISSRSSIAKALVVVVGACAVGTASTGAAMAAAPADATVAPAAAEAAKRKVCARGKVVVRRPGRSSVCAKKCRQGFKRKVSAKGKVSCVAKPKRKQGGSAPGASPQPPPAANGPAAGAYGGTSEQGRPIGFTVAGGQVTGFEAGVNTYCSTQGNQRIAFDAIANIPPLAIGADGSFSYTGPEESGNAVVKGRVVGGSATGTVSMSRGDSNFQGGQIYFGTCSAIDIPWSAAVR
jgi:hypothetical protein